MNLNNLKISTLLMREKNASKQQVVTTGFQLDSEYFNHVIELSYYYPKNTRKDDVPYTCYWNFSLSFLSLCHQLIGLSPQLFALWTLFHFPTWIVVKQFNRHSFPLNVNLHCISGLQFSPLPNPLSPGNFTN